MQTPFHSSPRVQTEYHTAARARTPQPQALQPAEHLQPATTAAAAVACPHTTTLRLLLLQTSLLHTSASPPAPLLAHRTCVGDTSSPLASAPTLTISPTGLISPSHCGWKRAPFLCVATVGSRDSKRKQKNKQRCPDGGASEQATQCVRPAINKKTALPSANTPHDTATTTRPQQLPIV